MVYTKCLYTRLLLFTIMLSWHTIATETVVTVLAFEFTIMLIHMFLGLLSIRHWYLATKGAFTCYFVRLLVCYCFEFNFFAFN